MLKHYRFGISTSFVSVEDLALYPWSLQEPETVVQAPKKEASQTGQSLPCSVGFYEWKMVFTQQRIGIQWKEFGTSLESTNFLCLVFVLTHRRQKPDLNALAALLKAEIAAEKKASPGQQHALPDFVARRYGLHGEIHV